MLEINVHTDGRQFGQAISRYLADLLHAPVDVSPVAPMRDLPAFLGRAYTFYETRIFGRHCILAARFDEIGTPVDIAKHIGIVHKATDAIVVFATPAISAYNRSRLIGQGVPFVVPGNQLYMPDLAIDLREHFRAYRQREADGITPAGQVVLFHRLLHADSDLTTPSLLARRLNYSAMSIGRAFDDLAIHGLAETVKHGKERHIHFKVEGQRLLEAAKPLLRSPVRALKFVRGNVIGSPLLEAGETALARLTDLARPRIDTFAVAASNWKTLSHTHGLIEVDRHEAECVIETWSYDPAALSDKDFVDALSLYAQFHDHGDERVAMAAEQLLEEGLPW